LGYNGLLTRNHVADRVYSSGCDYQTAHTQDELYIVMKGSGTLMIEDTPFPFVEGDALFVPATRQHRFSQFSQDLITWAVFWGPAGGEKE